MYFFMLPKIFSASAKNIRILQQNLFVLANERIQHQNVEIQSLNQKIKLFKTLRNIIMIYLGTILLANAVRIVIAWNFDWINSLLNEIVVFLMICGICYILLPYNRYLFLPVVVIDDPFSLSEIDELLTSNSGKFFIQFLYIYQKKKKNFL